MKVDLKDRVSIITGAGRGIGREIAILLAKSGSNLALCDLDYNAVREVATEVTRLEREVIFFNTDVSKQNEVESMVGEVNNRFGRIDILVNNAGITRDGLLLRMKDEDWDSVIDVNLKGTFNFTRATLKVMFKQRSGRIVNIASVVGEIGNAGQSNYCASKAGVIGFTKSVAKEYANRGINVNAIAPGFIETQMTMNLSQKSREEFLKQIPMQRPGQPIDVANTVLFLVSEEASYITGQVINVNGGMYM